MKNIVFLFSLLLTMAFPSRAALPPLERNQITTNVAPWTGVLIPFDLTSVSNTIVWNTFYVGGASLFDGTAYFKTNTFGEKTNSFTYIQSTSIRTNRLVFFGGDSNLTDSISVPDIISVSNQTWFSTNLLTTLLATNSGSASNLSLNLSGTSYRRIEVFLTNNATLTNFTGLLTGTYCDVAIHFFPQLIVRGLGLPSFKTATLGTFISTNVNAPIYSALTNGTEYVLSISTRGTNQNWSMTVW